ncbi:MAG TPA: ABC transporter permease [Candidatus Competibacteraceae bacterium]|nr:ABC transporter permease [Candidatus Competibacteraceae bacterium]MCP5133542.1 ABC transporter permease [Gammaproteobacteria bacterium]HPF58814.1 ABC transporter permease [Candidatus Competibacteraceae bacterium]HRY18325.1 ABC transporter permease [Candidatus Competibacteraceae bacterium]
MNLSWSRLRAQIIKELLSILRDRRARAILIGPPLVQLFLFSFAATLDVRNVSIAVYDRDGGRWSQELVASIGAATFVGRLVTALDAQQLQEAIERRQVLLAIDIPETFSRDVAAGRPAPLQVIADGRRANSGQVALRYVENIASNLGATIQAAVSSSGGSLAIRHWFNPNLIYRWFVVPSLAGTLAMFTSLIVTALSIARERELGTFDQLLVSPTTPAEIIVAKAAPALIIGTALGMLMVGAGVFAFGIPFTGSLGLLFLTMLLFILSIVGVGLMISSICATQQQAILGAFATGVPMILMSGFATPVENMPAVLQWVAEAIPLTHFLIIVQGTFVKALPAADVAAQAWPMAVTALVTLSAATVLVRSRLQ